MDLVSRLVLWRGTRGLYTKREPEHHHDREGRDPDRRGVSTESRIHNALLFFRGEQLDFSETYCIFASNIETAWTQLNQEHVK